MSVFRTGQTGLTSIASNVLLLVGILGCFFGYIPQRMLDGTELICLSWLTLSAVSIFIIPRRRAISCVWIGLFLIVSFFSMMFNFGPVTKTVFGILLIGCIGIVSFAERITFSKKQIGYVLIWVWIGQYASLILQRFSGWYPDIWLWAGTLIMPWVMGCAAVMSIPFIRAVKPWYCIILVLPLMLSESKVDVVIALIVFVQLRKLNWKVISSVVLAAALYIIFLDKNLDVARWQVWVGSIQKWDNHIIGDGIGSYAHHAFIRHNGLTPEWWRWAHNEFFQTAFETGLIGLNVLCGFIITIWFKISVEMRYALFGIISLSMVHSIAHLPVLAMFLILNLIYILKEANEN